VAAGEVLHNPFTPAAHGGGASRRRSMWTSSARPDRTGLDGSDCLSATHVNLELAGSRETGRRSGRSSGTNPVTKSLERAAPLSSPPRFTGLVAGVADQLLRDPREPRRRPRTGSRAARAGSRNLIEEAPGVRIEGLRNRTVRCAPSPRTRAIRSASSRPGNALVASIVILPSRDPSHLRALQRSSRTGRR